MDSEIFFIIRIHLYLLFGDRCYTILNGYQKIETEDSRMENDRYEGLDIADETIELLNSDLESFLIDLDDEEDSNYNDSRKSETFEEQMKKT